MASPRLSPFAKPRYRTRTNKRLGPELRRWTPYQSVRSSEDVRSRTSRYALPVRVAPACAKSVTVPARYPLGRHPVGWRHCCCRMPPFREASQTVFHGLTRRRQRESARRNSEVFPEVLGGVRFTVGVASATHPAEIRHRCRVSHRVLRGDSVMRRSRTTRSRYACKSTSARSFSTPQR